MGMFDTLKVNLILPGNSIIVDDEFQTKSFDCTMSKYVITAGGTIYEDFWEYEWRDEPAHFLGGQLNKIEGSNEHIYLTDFTGEVIFYTSRPMWSNKWRDYHAQFVNGRLSRIWYNDKQY